MCDAWRAVIVTYQPPLERIVKIFTELASNVSTYLRGIWYFIFHPLVGPGVFESFEGWNVYSVNGQMHAVVPRSSQRVFPRTFPVVLDKRHVPTTVETKIRVPVSSGGLEVTLYTWSRIPVPNSETAIRLFPIATEEGRERMKRAYILAAEHAFEWVAISLRTGIEFPNFDFEQCIGYAFADEILGRESTYIERRNFEVRIVEMSFGEFRIASENEMYSPKRRELLEAARKHGFAPHSFCRLSEDRVGR